eukprot:324724-Prymnesium_polylepis.1
MIAPTRERALQNHGCRCDTGARGARVPRILSCPATAGAAVHDGLLAPACSGARLRSAKTKAKCSR